MTSMPPGEMVDCGNIEELRALAFASIPSRKGHQRSRLKRTRKRTLSEDRGEGERSLEDESPPAVRQIETVFQGPREEANASLNNIDAVNVSTSVGIPTVQGFNSSTREDIGQQTSTKVVLVPKIGEPSITQQAPAVTTSIQSGGIRKEADAFLASLNIPLAPKTSWTPNMPSSKSNSLVIKFSEDDSDSEGEEQSFSPCGSEAVKIDSDIKNISNKVGGGLTLPNASLSSQSAGGLKTEIDRMKKQIAAIERMKGGTKAGPSKLSKTVSGDAVQKLTPSALKNPLNSGPPANSRASLDLENLRQQIAAKENELQIRKRQALKESSGTAPPIVKNASTSFDNGNALISRVKAIAIPNSVDEVARDPAASELIGEKTEFVVKTLDRPLQCLLPIELVVDISQLKSVKDSDKTLTDGQHSHPQAEKLVPFVSHLPTIPTNDENLQIPMNNIDNRVCKTLRTCDDSRLPISTISGQNHVVDVLEHDDHRKNKSATLFSASRTPAKRKLEEDESELNSAHDDAIATNSVKKQRLNESVTRQHSAIPKEDLRFAINTQSNHSEDVPSTNSQVLEYVLKKGQKSKLIAVQTVEKNNNLPPSAAEGGSKASCGSVRMINNEATPSVARREMLSPSAPHHPELNRTAPNFHNLDKGIEIVAGISKALVQPEESREVLHEACPKTKFLEPACDSDNVRMGISSGSLQEGLDTGGGKLLEELLEEEELMEKELEAVQQSRRRCEVRERLARKHLREAQQALHAANLQCNFLYEKRELLSARIQAAQIQGCFMKFSSQEAAHERDRSLVPYPFWTTQGFQTPSYWSKEERLEHSLNQVQHNTLTSTQLKKVTDGMPDYFNTHKYGTLVISEMKDAHVEMPSSDTVGPLRSGNSEGAKSLNTLCEDTSHNAILDASHHNSEESGKEQSFAGSGHHSGESTVSSSMAGLDNNDSLNKSNDMYATRSVYDSLANQSAVGETDQSFRIQRETEQGFSSASFAVVSDKFYTAHFNESQTCKIGNVLEDNLQQDSHGIRQEVQSPTYIPDGHNANSLLTLKVSPTTSAQGQSVQKDSCLKHAVPKGNTTNIDIMPERAKDGPSLECMMLGSHARLSFKGRQSRVESKDDQVLLSKEIELSYSENTQRVSGHGTCVSSASTELKRKSNASEPLIEIPTVDNNIQDEMCDLGDELHLRHQKMLGTFQLDKKLLTCSSQSGSGTLSSQLLGLEIRDMEVDLPHTRNVEGVKDHAAVIDVDISDNGGEPADLVMMGADVNCVQVEHRNKQQKKGNYSDFMNRSAKLNGSECLASVAQDGSAGKVTAVDRKPHEGDDYDSGIDDNSAASGNSKGSLGGETYPGDKERQTYMLRKNFIRNPVGGGNHKFEGNNAVSDKEQVSVNMELNNSRGYSDLMLQCAEASGSRELHDEIEISSWISSCKYASPLSAFRSYNVYPHLSSIFGSSLDSQKPICSFELRGKCNNDSCPWQHRKDYALTNNEISDQTRRISEKALSCPQPFVEMDSSEKRTEENSGSLIQATICMAITQPSNLGNSLQRTWKDYATKPPPYRIGSNLVKADSSLGFVPVTANKMLFQKFSFGQSSLPIRRRLALDMPCLLDNSLKNIIPESADPSSSAESLAGRSYLNLEEHTLKNVKEVETMLDMVLSLIDFDSKMEKTEGRKSALYVLSRALEVKPSSPALWVLYLNLFYRREKTIGKDDMFYCAVQLNKASYELWLMFINSRINLTERLAGYKLAILDLCDVENSDVLQKRQSSCLLDLVLQMLNCLCSLGSAKEGALSWIDGLATCLLEDVVEEDEVLERKHTLKLLSCLREYDLCILWISCAYIVAHQCLPLCIVERLGYQKQLPSGLDWEKGKAGNSCRTSVMELLHMGASSGRGGLALYSQQLQVDDDDALLAKEALAINLLQCSHIYEGPDLACALGRKLITLFPTCVGLVSVCFHIEKKKQSPIAGLNVFAEAQLKWPANKPGFVRLWSQYIGHALDIVGMDHVKTLLLRFSDQIEQISVNLDEFRLAHPFRSRTRATNEVADIVDRIRWTCQSMQSLKKIHLSNASAVPLTNSDIVFGFAILAVAEILYGSIEAADLALDNALEIAVNVEDLSQCMKIVLPLYFKGLNKTKAYDNTLPPKMLGLFDRCFLESRLFTTLLPLSSLSESIKKRRVRLLIESLLGPSLIDYSLFNSILEACFGPSLLPDDMSLKSWCDIVEGLMELAPCNVDLAASACRIVRRRIESCKEEMLVSSSIILWSTSQLIDALYHSSPTAPEHYWLEAGISLEILSVDSLLEDFYQHALLAHPFSLLIWRRFLSVSKRVGTFTKALESARQKGLTVDENFES